MQPFERPAAGHKSLGQIVEKLRMRRRLALPAEVAGRAYKAPPEMVSPNTIDDDTRCKRLRFGEERVGQLAPPAALLEGARRHRREHFEESSRHDFAPIGWIAALIDPE